MRQFKKIRIFLLSFLVGASSAFGQDDFEITDWGKHYNSIGETLLANEIVGIELKDGREKPVRLPLDICEAPESYPIQEGRLLVRCKQKAELACLDIKKDQGNFGGDNDLRTLTRNASFGIRENIFCFVLKNFSEK